MKFEAKSQGLIKKLMLTGQLNRIIVISITAVCIAIFSVLAFLTVLGVISGLGTAMDFVILSILSGTGIYGFYEYFHVRHIYKIDSVFPDFVRDLAESRRAGMTFTKAILFASKGNYGVLTDEIQKIAQQVSWGSNVTDALMNFAKRVNTHSIRRTISLIIESSKSGGNVADVLDVAARDAREIKNLEAERRANMASYVVVIYVGMFVFLAIIAVLNLTFIPEILNESGSSLSGVMGGGYIDPNKVAFVFYLATIVQGMGSGIVAGVFEDGNYYSSVKHVFVMVLICWLVYKILFGM